MKNILLVLGIIMGTYASAQVAQTTTEIDKTMRPALYAPFKHAPKLISDALDGHLKELGIKGGKGLKGWTLYEGALIEKISASRLDYYFKVEQNGKNKEESLLYLSLSKGYGNFVDANTDAELYNKATLWFSDFLNVVEQHKLGIDITAAESAHASAIKAYEKSVKDGENISAQLKENEKDQQAKKSEVEKMKSAVDALKARRATK